MVARLLLTVVFPTPPFGPSTTTSGASSVVLPGDVSLTWETRAIAFWTAADTTAASVGSSTISCAPALSASARFPFALPGIAITSAISGRERRLSDSTSRASFTSGANISSAWL